MTDRYTYEAINWLGVNGFMIFDNKDDPKHEKGICFAFGQVGPICTALNSSERRLLIEGDPEIDKALDVHFSKRKVKTRKILKR